MTDQVEQSGQPLQDPAQTASASPSQPAAPPAAAPATQASSPPAPAGPPPTPGPAPWNSELEQTFTDPGVRAQVDQYIRSRWQPRMTQYEQQIAESQDARQMYEAFQADPDAANIAVNRQLYGDDYADQIAAGLGRYDQMVNQPQPAQPTQNQQVQQPVQPQAAQPQAAPGDPVYDYWANKYQEETYDEAVDEFLKDPQYADIQKDLFHTHLKGAETWEDAVASYRNYAAFWAQQNGADPNAQPPQPPPTIGSQTVGTVGATPATPVETLNEAIDNMFNENKPLAPPMLGQQ